MSMNSKKAEVTVHEIDIIIKQSEQGDYDQYHEWSPSYSLEDKANLLFNMLNNWNYSTEDAKKLIIDFTKKLIHDSGTSSYIVTDKLVLFAQLNEIKTAVEEFLYSGIFCCNLLTSMKNHSVILSDWIEKIKSIYNDRKFSESNRDLKRHEVYEKIEKLIF